MRPPRAGEKREWKRFSIDSPVTIEVTARAKMPEVVDGKLLDISAGGACIRVSRRLEPHARVVVRAHFRGPNQHATTVRFEGFIQRVEDQPPYEVAVKFRRPGRILRDEAADFFASHKPR